MALRSYLSPAYADWGRGAVGAALGIGLAALTGALVLGQFAPALPLLVASMGASAVLVFVRPASPFSQPWPVVGGNVVAALAGLAAGRLTGSPIPAMALGVGLAIAGMSLLRALHPPGGGTALIYAVGAAGAEPWGWHFLLAVTINALALAACGWIYNNLTGHPWPHRMTVPPAPVRQAGQPAALTSEDVASVIAEWDEPVDIAPDDLLALIQAVERQRDRRSSASSY